MSLAPLASESMWQYRLYTRERLSRIHLSGGYYTDVCTNELQRYFAVEQAREYRLCITPEQPDQRLRDRRYVEACLLNETHSARRLGDNPLHLRFANATYWTNVATPVELDEWMEATFKYNVTYYVWLEFTEESWEQFSANAWKCKCCYTLNNGREEVCVRCDRPRIGRPVGWPVEKLAAIRKKKREQRAKLNARHRKYYRQRREREKRKTNDTD